MIEQIIAKIDNDSVVLVGLTSEETDDMLDARLSKYKATIMRFDAAVVAHEVDSARRMQIEMQRQAREELRKQKSDEFKSKIEEQRSKMKAQFEEFKTKLKK